MGGMTMLSSTSRTPPSRDGWDFCGGSVCCTCAKHDTLFSHRTASQRIPAIEVRIADSSQSHHVRSCYVLKPVLKASKPRHLRENRACPGTQRQVHESRHFFHSLTPGAYTTASTPTPEINNVQSTPPRVFDSVPSGTLLQNAKFKSDFEARSPSPKPATPIRSATTALHLVSDRSPTPPAPPR